MRARVTAAAAAALSALLLAGCGSAAGVRVGSPDLDGSGTRPVCGDIVVNPGGDGAREVCLSVGSTLRLRLGRGERATEKGAALTEISPGVYRGARAGGAELNGFRPACPSASPGAMSCHALAGWKVAVDVR